MLVCERLPDPEIAAQQFMTTEAASQHVTQTLTKRGASNRRRAAAIAAHHLLV